MSEMDGIEAAKIIHRYRRNSKILIMTRYGFVKEKAADIESFFF